MLDPISLSFTTLTTGGFVPISTSLNPANSITCYNYEWNDNCSLRAVVLILFVLRNSFNQLN